MSRLWTCRHQLTASAGVWNATWCRVPGLPALLTSYLHAQAVTGMVVALHLPAAGACQAIRATADDVQSE